MSSQWVVKRVLNAAAAVGATVGPARLGVWGSSAQQQRLMFRWFCMTLLAMVLGSCVVSRRRVRVGKR